MPARCPKRPILDGRKHVCALPPDHPPPCVPDPAPQGRPGPPPGEPTGIVSLRVPMPVVEAWAGATGETRERARTAFLRALRGGRS